MVIKEFTCKKFKITVEEKHNNTFIATLWDKENELEFDRRVFQFETFGGACDKAFDLLSVKYREKAS